MVKIKQAGPSSVGLRGRAAEHRATSALAPMPGCRNLSWEPASDTHRRGCGQGVWYREPPPFPETPLSPQEVDSQQGRPGWGPPCGLLGAERAGP